MKPLILTALMLNGALAAPARLIEGKAGSPVRVVIYEDLACSDCAVFRKMMDEHLLPKFGSRVAFEHRDFPLAKHPWARAAAVVGRHFEQSSGELAVRWRREVLRDRRQITTATLAEYIQAFSKRNGVDGAKAIAALEDAQLQAAVEKDYQDGVARGIARTPTVLVNGEPYIETFTVEEISKGIDAALRENNIQ